MLSIKYISIHGHDEESYDPKNEKEIEGILSRLKEKLKQGCMFIVSKPDAKSKEDEDVISIKMTKKDGTKKSKEEIIKEVEEQSERIEKNLKDTVKDKKLVVPPVTTG